MKRLKYIVLFLLTLFSLDTNAQTLDELFQQAVENNPQLKAVQLEYEASLEKASQVNQLPNPQVGIGIPVMRPETRLGAQVVTVSVSQMFPWFGTLKAKKDVVVSMSKTKFEKISALKLELFYTIEAAYYQLSLIDKKQAILQKNISIYESWEKIALAKVESGNSTIANVLQIQTKLLELQQQIELLENDKLVFYAKINEVINRPTSSTIQVYEPTDTIASLNYDENLFRQRIQDFHPLMQQLNHQIEASQKEQAVNKAEGKPFIGLGLDYSNVLERTDAIPDNNGRDILIPKIIVSIPVYRKKFKSKHQEEELNQEAYLYKKEYLEDKIMTMIFTYKTEYDNAAFKILSTKEQLKILETAKQVLYKEYSVSDAHFDEVLVLQNQLIAYELNIEKYRIETYIAKAEIDRLTKF